MMVKMHGKKILILCAGAFVSLAGSVHAAAENFTLNFPAGGNGTTTIINRTFTSESYTTLYAVIIVFTLAIVALLFYQAFLKKR
jgi:ATP-dependent protease Clp ATPase subunit